MVEEAVLKSSFAMVEKPELDLRIEELEDLVDPADPGVFWGIFVGGFAAGATLAGVAVAT